MSAKLSKEFWFALMNYFPLFSMSLCQFSIHYNLCDYWNMLNVMFVFSVPLVSRILPSDVCKIHKSGACLRLVMNPVDIILL
jgi:hypothetical protein